MAATDTIVGITGAVLLAVVMVGVFVYEYNNAPAGADTKAAAIAHFHEDFPALNATGDINQDGIPNYRDPAFNRTGDLYAVFTFSGTMPQPTPPATAAGAQDFTVHVEQGQVNSTFTLTYATTLPAPVPQVPRAPTLAFDLLAPDGSKVDSGGSGTQQGTTVTSVLQTQALPPGQYTIHVTETLGGPSSNFSVKAVLDYGHGHPATAGDHTHA